MTTRQTDRLGAVDLWRTSELSLLDDVVQRRLPAGTHVHFTNAWSIVSADADQRLAQCLARGACAVDGLPVIWGLRAVHRGRWTRGSRVRGPDFFRAAMDRGRSTGVRHFLLGGSESTLRSLVDRLHQDHPGVAVVGAESPPYAPVEDVDWSSYLQLIRDSEADVVWVGLGTPKQDYVAAHLAELDERPYLAVGAAFDFAAGTVRRAPRWMQETGLEWLFRLLAEPRRLWRRYLLGNLQFLAIVGRELVRGRRGAA